MTTSFYKNINFGQLLFTSSQLKNSNSNLNEEKAKKCKIYLTNLFKLRRQVELRMIYNQNSL